MLVLTINFEDDRVDGNDVDYHDPDSDPDYYGSDE